jgi:hypothetical protein
MEDAGADADSYAGVFEAMAHELADGDFADYENGAFLNHVGEYMLDWLTCLDQLVAAQPTKQSVLTTGDD